MSNYQKREAARIGNQRAIDSSDEDSQRKARELRAENQRRAVAAGGAA